MLKLFKSTPKPPAPAKPAAARTGMPPAPPPLPEVGEGNQESDWAMWEDSVAFQDSQMPSVFNEFDAVRTRNEEPKKNGEPDPFPRCGAVAPRVP